MKLKKLVSALVSGAMILGTMAAVPVFAEDDVVVKEPEVIDIEPAFDETDSAAQNIIMMSDEETTTTENVTVVSTQTELAEALVDADVTSISLLNNIEMTGVWTPANISRDLTINGNGYTISNMVVDAGLRKPSGSGVAGDGGSCDYQAGFIGNNTGNLTINDLKFSNANVDMNPLSLNLNSTGSSQLAVVLGANNGGNAVFNNVEVYNSVVKGYTKVGCLVGHVQGGTVTMNKCALDSNTVVLEGDGTDKWAALSGVIAGYDPLKKITTNGIKLVGNENIIDTSCDFGSDKIIQGDGIVTCAGYGLICDTYATGSYASNPVRFVASVNDYQYTSLQKALAAAQDGDTIKLLSDITISEQITVNKEFTLNLNGHTITSNYQYGTAQYNSSYTFVLYKDATILGASQDGIKGSIVATNSIPIASVGHLTIKDAEIKAVSANENAYFVLTMFGDLDLENCIITGDTPDNFAVTSMNSNNSFNIVNSVINATGEAIYHNGSHKNFTLNVENSTLNANYDGQNQHTSDETLGMYVSGSKALESLHNLTLKNSTVIGGTGIEIKYANLNMENCTVNATNPLSYEKNNNGSTAQGFAIVATDNTMDQEAADPQGKISINGGNYVGTIGLENFAKNVARDTDVTITGGTFTTDVAKYVANGYYQKTNEDNTYTVLPTEATVIDSAKTTGATVTLDGLKNNAAVDHKPDATYKVVVETAPKDDVAKANEAIAANDNDTNTSKAIFDISVVKIDSNGVETDLGGENGVKDQQVTLTLGETPLVGSPVYVYHVVGTAEQIKTPVAIVTADGTNKVTFTAPSFSTYAATYTATPIAEANIAKNVGVVFERVGDTSEYNIVLKALDSKTINRFMSADLTFDMNVTSGAVGYTVNPAASVNLIDKGDGRYEFNLDGLTSSGATGTEVTIGTVTFEGNGTVEFGVKTEGVTTNIVNTAKAADNIVDNYTTAGNGTDTGRLELNNAAANGVINATFTAPKKTLTVNIAYNNKINNNAAAYQDMTVTISGGDLSGTKTVELGTTPVKSGFADPANATVTYDADKSAYTVKVANELTQNVAYTVTVEGLGYRTARYTVTMTANKTLNFWNNVMDAAQVVEVGKTEGAVKTNFLAGDIVKDNNINIYDLSAVVSYFGETGLINDDGDANAYAKYDLNRDGKIDSKDVAYVLVSWGK